ncbi:hypothetical protein [Curvivirga aplysinae]|uniref:hypothetical protein n=1 Tax=Curvivirga aplysinae TaxID=2529852 RepID=UPI0012BCFB7B|nr:hypothetical protein [Curvivirga aplysinae]MTI10745.1 hypothetical protein [Curvivirga aplysinae]
MNQHVNSEPEIFVNAIISLHKKGAKPKSIQNKISKSFPNIPNTLQFIEQVIQAHEEGIDLFAPQNFWQRHPLLKELGLFLVAFIVVYVISMLLSFLLGIISMMFEAINLDFLGALLVKFGGGIGGIAVGFIGTLIAKEYQSLGAIVGCWIGAVAYYITILTIYYPG